jgi:hypothetical protein
MMALTRKNKLVAAVVGVPTLSLPLMIVARSAPQLHAVMQLAVLPQATRPRKQRWNRTVRRTRSRLLHRRRESMVWSAPRGLNLRPRLPLCESYARGPPRRSQTNSAPASGLPQAAPTRLSRTAVAMTTWP